MRVDDGLSDPGHPPPLPKGSPTFREIAYGAQRSIPVNKVLDVHGDPGIRIKNIHRLTPHDPVAVRVVPHRSDRLLGVLYANGYQGDDDRVRLEDVLVGSGPVHPRMMPDIERTADETSGCPDEASG